MKVYIVKIDIESIDCVFRNKQDAINYAVEEYCATPFFDATLEDKIKHVLDGHIEEYDLK